MTTETRTDSSIEEARATFSGAIDHLEKVLGAFEGLRAEKGAVVSEQSRASNLLGIASWAARLDGAKVPTRTVTNLAATEQRIRELEAEAAPSHQAMVDSLKALWGAEITLQNTYITIETEEAAQGRQEALERKLQDTLQDFPGMDAQAAMKEAERRLQALIEGPESHALTRSIQIKSPPGRNSPVRDGGHSASAAWDYTVSQPSPEVTYYPVPHWAHVWGVVIPSRRKRLKTLQEYPERLGQHEEDLAVWAAKHLSAARQTLEKTV